MPKNTNPILAAFIGLILAGAMSPQTNSSTTANTFEIECKFIGGFFQGNGYKYLISNNHQHVRLLTASEVANGIELITEENADLVVISSGNQIITFADARLEATEQTLYLERLNLATMTSTTLTIAKLDSSKPFLERDASKCRRLTAGD